MMSVDILFFIIILMILICMTTILVSGLIQFFFPNIKFGLIVIILYCLGSVFLLYKKWQEEWILLSIVVLCSLIAVGLVKTFTKVYKMTEKKLVEDQK
jgi:hypothetical protein